MNSEIMHPTTDLLTDYIESPTASEFSDVRTHLINCKECRFEANRLVQFKASLIKEIPHFRNNQYDMDPGLQQIYQDADIEAYVDGALTGADEQKISTLLQNDKSALKSALHYATHEAAMAPTLIAQSAENHNTLQAQRIENNSDDASEVSRRSGFRDTLNQLFDWRPSGWLSIPLTAVAVFALSVILVPQLQLSSNQNWNMATYQDKQLLRYKQAATPSPGIGFFSNAAVTHKPFDNIDINYKQNRLHLNWQAVQDAQQYTFSLYTGKNKKKSLITMTTTKTNSAVIDKLDLQLAQHYSWELNGQTIDQSIFSVSGGFVISER